LAACVPTPLSIDTEVTFVVVHESVEELPTLIVDGVAVKLLIEGGGLTVTVVVAVAVPPAPVAVSV